MAACATERKIADINRVGNLILPIPDTDFRDFLDEVDELSKFAPQIIDAIEKDLDVHAREKKKLRQEDGRFFASATADFAELNIEEADILAGELNLGTGRPRMPAYAVYVFLMIRGFLGSLTTKAARRFLLESMSLYGFVQARGLKIPAVTTILENVNLVSHATRELIFDQQIGYILQEQWDDFGKLTIDSTAVKANSSWPTDAKVLTGVLNRAYRYGQKLHVFGLEDFRPGWVPGWLQQMDKLEFRICLVAGKANSKGKLKKHYRQLLKRGGKAAEALGSQLSYLEEGLSMQALPPSRRELLKRLLSQISRDVADAKRVIGYAHDRVFDDKKLPSTQKVLSLSDGSAAYIKKGSREAVIGYKPQLVRSENGFITSLIVEPGNPADSAQLVESISDSITRTGVVAELVSSDDGYASAKGRNELLAMGVKAVSISGAKGRKLTDPDDWESALYRHARRDRSAVESMMFTIKAGFGFGELGRRGIGPVSDELLEKGLAYNCCRIILMKKRRNNQQAEAA